jgi:arylsulfatase A-like enzyme
VVRNDVALREEVRSLAEILRDSGYRTAGTVANPLLESRFGFGQGFEHFSMPPTIELLGPGMLEGSAVVREAERLLDVVGDDPFFLWLHFMDPHGPYFPPERYRALFDAQRYLRTGEGDLAIAKSNYGFRIVPAYQAVENRGSPADYRARYDAEIRYTDDHVDAVLRALRSRGLLERSIVVLTADHGESLGEHDYYFQHGMLAYENSLRVPLLVRAPGLVPAGRRITPSISLIDVAPTILDLLGIDAANEMEGRSLLPLLRGEPRDRAAFAQTPYGDGRIALRFGAHKYIFSPPMRPTFFQPGVTEYPLRPTPAREELYDLTTDPGETRDLAPDRGAMVRRFRRRVERWLAVQGIRQARSSTGDAAQASPDPAITRQLQALGYVD